MQDKTDKIDIEMQKRMDTGVNMGGAIGWAQEQWDKELNKAYAKSLTRLKPKQAKMLRESQRTWVSFRDLETKLILTQMQADPNFTPSTSNPTRLGSYMRILHLTRTRALQLRAHANPLSDEHR